MQECQTSQTRRTSPTFLRSAICTLHFALLVLLLLPCSLLLAQSSPPGKPDQPTPPSQSNPPNQPSQSNPADWTPPEPKPRINYPLGLVYYEDWNQGYYTGVSQVESLDTYLDWLTRRSLSQSYEDSAEQQQLNEELASGQQGLIPEINLPKIPLFGASKIDITGQDRITFGGDQTIITGLPQLTQGQSWLPELKMEQALQVSVNGTIGDKTKVFLDHDSQREQDQTKISLTYTGSEDDIVQSVQAGDAALTIPGTTYTGDLPSHQGLFGLTAQGKLGGIDLYGVAAQEQSQSQTQTFELKNQSHIDTIYDTDFLRWTFFSVDTPVNGSLPALRYPITNLRVYVDDANPYNNNSAQQGRATVYPSSPGDTTVHYTGDVDDGFFDLKMPNTDYIFTSQTGIIQFLTPIGSNYTIGIAYDEGPDTVGGHKWWNEAISESVLVLKLIKPQTPDSTSLTWTNELKNVYKLSDRDVKLDTVEVIRWRANENPTVLDENGHKFTQLIGLDPDGDGIINWPQLDATNGYLIPTPLYPFTSESLTVPDSIYRLNNPNSWSRKYLFVVTYSTALSSYSLGQIDIIPNSEKVTVGGEPWTSGTDYKINYQTGELSFIKALPPNADIRATFEYTPLFSESQKTVVGTRAEWKFADNGKIGSSLFYRTEGTPETRPTLGDEPFRRMVAEADVNYGLSSTSITSLMDKVPFLRVDAPTTFHVGAEGAISLPDPNTQGAAYLDDFEGTTVSLDVPTSLRLWQFASVPVAKDSGQFARKPIRWLNPPWIAKDSIFRGLSDQEKTETEQYLRMCFFPDDLGSWAGLMNCPSRLGYDLTDLQNLEAVFRTKHHQGRIHITVATSIDEDAPRRRKDGSMAGLNGHEDTEDKNGNGVLDAGDGEDCGIDGVAGADADFPSIPGDDGNDDYNATTNPTGTEGNGQLDGEDLMGSGWTRENDYIEFSFRLDDTTVITNLNQDWKSLVIPLTDTTHSTTVGSPRLNCVKVVRVWFDSFPQPDTIDFYSLQFVGDKWQNPTVDTLPASGPADTSEKVAVTLISKKTDTSYTSPFVLTVDALGNTEQEASLSMTYQQIKPQHRAIVRKVSLTNDDYRDYSTLRVYVHDDRSNPTFFLQVGADSLDYYEFRQKVNTGTRIRVPGSSDTNWYELQVPLDTLPTLKARFGARPDTVTRLDVYSITGNPSLNDVRYMGMGIENTTNARLTGEIWVDDIRLTSPKTTIGYGFTSSASLQLSDLATVGLSYVYNDPDFRRFSEDRAVKTGDFSNGVGLTLNATLDRLLPASWGMSLPFSYTRNSSSLVPKYSSIYPDLRLTADSSKAKESGANLAESWNVSVHKNLSKNKLLNYTLDALSYSYQHSDGFARSMLDSSRASADNHSATYSISPDLAFHIGETEISYFPQSIHLTGTLTNNRSPAWQRTSDTTAIWSVLSSDSTLSAAYDFGVEYAPIEDLSFNYSTNSDLDRTDTGHVARMNLGQESDLDEDFTASYDVDLNELLGEKSGIGDWLTPKLDFDGNYTEERPRSNGHYGANRNVTNQGNVSFSLDLDLPTALAALGKLRDQRKDAKAQPGSVQWFMVQLGKSSDILSAVDFSYTHDVSSDYTNIMRRPSALFQLGFTDAYTDTINPVIGQTEEVNNEITVSTGLRYKDIDTRWHFDRTWNVDVSGSTPSGGYNLTWPDIGLTLSGVEHIAPKLLTTSSLSSSYQRQVSFAGTYDYPNDTFQSLNRRITTTDNLSPILSWQATWKNKFTTTLSANYSNAISLTYLEPQTATQTRNLTDNLAFSLGYTFSAPHGIRIPGLKKLKFTSDLSIDWGLTYGKTFASTTELNDSIVPSEDSRDIGTTISLSYRFSNSIESGLTGGYTAHDNIESNINTHTTTLNFWVLFKF